ncbi:hypothetical protein PRVXT_002751 [Proteinivorax tanatarense]|uniref:Uncharacterized protein n=1 Tax=Proteinivorax tanatarense TaxID=1260629 RepID=A0AAU7VL46_9FIRM
MKKLLSLFFVLMFSMAVLVGCGGDQDVDLDEQPPVEENGGVEDEE